jgi:hypothetical protein
MLFQLGIRSCVLVQQEAKVNGVNFVAQKVSQHRPKCPRHADGH